MPDNDIVFTEEHRRNGWTEESFKKYHSETQAILRQRLCVSKQPQMIIETANNYNYHARKVRK